MKKSVIFLIGGLLILTAIVQGRPRPHRLGLEEPTAAIGPVREHARLWSLDEDTLHNVDILSYQLSAEVHISTQLIDGPSTISMRAWEDSVTEPWMHFHGFEIDSIQILF